MPVFLQGGFDFFDFLGGLGSLFNALLQFILNALVFLFNLVIQIANFLFQAIVATVKFLLDGFRVLARALRHVLSDIIHLRFRHLLEDYLKLKARLQEIFAPVIRVLKRLREIQEEFFLKPLRRLIDLMQRVRQVLAVFRIFHLKFAERLDASLAKLEGKIIRNTLRVVQEINRITSLLELLVDPDLLFRRVPLFSSFHRALAELWAAIHGHKITGILRPFGPFGAGMPDGRKFSSFLADFREESRADTGQLGDFRALVLDMRDRLRDELGGSGEVS